MIFTYILSAILFVFSAFVARFLLLKIDKKRSWGKLVHHYQCETSKESVEEKILQGINTATNFSVGIGELRGKYSSDATMFFESKGIRIMGNMSHLNHFLGFSEIFIPLQDISWGKKFLKAQYLDIGKKHHPKVASILLSGYDVKRLQERHYI